MELGLIRRSLSHRNDSGSESPFDRKPVHKGTNSSADQALRRKQTRRCKKQMSERQRRRRMNSFMDMLGTLVYGKTFQEGLKVDKATLLKDAYEKLQEMRHDYRKGYQTAISATTSFIDSLESCPPEIKQALQRHLSAPLYVNGPQTTSTSSKTNAAVKSVQPQGKEHIIGETSVTTIINEQSESSDCTSVADDTLQTKRHTTGTFSTETPNTSRHEKKANVFCPCSYASAIYSPAKTIAQVAPLITSNSGFALHNGIPTSRVKSTSTCQLLLTSSSAGLYSKKYCKDNVYYSTALASSSSPYSSCNGAKLNNIIDLRYQRLPSSNSVSLTSCAITARSLKNTSCSTPRIAPYVTPFAPHNPLYISHQPYNARQYEVLSPTLMGAPAFSTLHPLPASAQIHRHNCIFLQSADDSGYLSSDGKVTRLQFSSSKVLGSDRRDHFLQPASSLSTPYTDSDEEVDREVEEVFSNN